MSVDKKKSILALPIISIVTGIVLIISNIKLGICFIAIGLHFEIKNLLRGK